MEGLRLRNEELVSKLQSLNQKFKQDFQDRLEEQIKGLLQTKDETLVENT